MRTTVGGVLQCLHSDPARGSRDLAGFSLNVTVLHHEPKHAEFKTNGILLNVFVITPTVDSILPCLVWEGFILTALSDREGLFWKTEQKVIFGIK